MSRGSYPEIIEVHGHRGARGYYPENTILSFIEAVKLGVTAVEMDVVISKDNKVVVSHEPWMNDLFCSYPDGRPVEKNSREKLNLFKMEYVEIAKFDCGKRGNKEFPLQKGSPQHKPLLSEVVMQVDKFTSNNRFTPVKYNIEIKTEESEADGVFNPDPNTFVDLVCEQVKALDIVSRCNLQSFDVRILEEIKKKDKKIEIAFLVENKEGFENNLSRLDFMPDTYSPEFILVDEKLVQIVHEKKMRIIPWTVNEKNDIQKMINLGVDGIISDYPDRVIDLIKNKT